jgi:endonuclease YncB( thermonuclease family)
MRAAVHAVVLAVSLLGAWSAQAATYSARVVSITDGDTLHALYEGREVIARLRWIAAPEKGQSFGDQAREALGKLVAGQVVIVRDYGPDGNGRRLAEVVLADGRNVNRELVRLGWAWWFRKYSHDGALGTLEAEARSAACGLIRIRCRPGSGEPSRHPGCDDSCSLPAPSGPDGSCRDGH